MTTATAEKIELTGNQASFPLWKRTARPLVEIARAIPYLAAVWRGEYRPAPHAIKMRVLKAWVPDPAGMTLVETGTFLGDTVVALRHAFGRIVSIEINPALYAIAQSRVASARNVELVLGDCVVELPKILSKLDTRAVFWLDGHWSGGVTGRGVVDDPILISLSQIAKHPHKKHILFIDDARTFQGGGSGPDLVHVLSAIREINSDYKIVIHNDIIVATPGREGS